MILTKSPMRISFIGGGTDLKSFYEKCEYGSVISTAINKYVYIGVNDRFDGKIRLAYSKNEIISNINQIKNDRIKCAMRNLDINRGIEIFYISDVPKNMGLGGSSTFTIGILHSLHAFKKNKIGANRLAEEACEIEINQLGNPIGKQDQYASAFGGFNYIQFFSDGTVSVQPINIDKKSLNNFMKNLLFIYLDKPHDSSKILDDVNRNIDSNFDYLDRLNKLTKIFQEDLLNNSFNSFSDILRESWEIKKKTSKMISDSYIDDLYNKSLDNGAEAGKILGAGGGGFLMLYVPIDKQKYFFNRSKSLKIFRFAVDYYGSQIVHNDSFN